MRHFQWLMFQILHLSMGWPWVTLTSLSLCFFTCRRWRNTFLLLTPTYCTWLTWWRSCVVMTAKAFWNSKGYKMIRSLWLCIKSSAAEDLRGACTASGEMYNRGTFSEDTKAVPNYLLNGVQKKAFIIQRNKWWLWSTRYSFRERLRVKSVLENLNNWAVQEPRWS